MALICLGELLEPATLKLIPIEYEYLTDSAVKAVFHCFLKQIYHVLLVNARRIEIGMIVYYILHIQVYLMHNI